MRKMWCSWNHETNEPNYKSITKIEKEGYGPILVDFIPEYEDKLHEAWETARLEDKHYNYEYSFAKWLAEQEDLK